MKKLAIFGALALFCWACSADKPEPGESSVPTTASQPKPALPTSKAPYSHGDLNEILVIADDALWEGEVGDTFFYYFTAPYILLPQPESIFDVRHMTPEELLETPAKREFRTILFLADLSEKESLATQLVKGDLNKSKIAEAMQGDGYSTIVGKDKWANDQILFYIVGNGPDKLTENITQNFAPIARRINEKDLVTVQANAYQSGESSAMKKMVLEKMGLSLRVPGDFKLARHIPEKNFLWLRRDDRELVANIIIHKRPYTSKDQLTREGIKEIQDELGRLVTSQQPNSYMLINDWDLPLFVENINVNGLFTVEARGIWEMENDFKGGPFLSYLMLDPTTNELIFIDGFLYAPSKSNKRDYMQEMELIISSIKPATEQ